MGVLGAPLYHVGAIWGIYWYVRRLSMENGTFEGYQYAYYGEFPYKAAPIRFFKIVWGLPAGAEDPQIQVNFTR
jgi:hypothetical protein